MLQTHQERTALDLRTLQKSYLSTEGESRPVPHSDDCMRVGVGLSHSGAKSQDLGGE